MAGFIPLCRAEQIPSVARDIQEHRDPAVRLGAWRAGELDADDAFAIGEWLGDVDDAALSLKFGVDAASDTLGWNANLKIGADRDVE